jgi:WD40 repeat protein
LLATLSGHGRAVAEAKFSADGKRIVTGSHDKTARVWDAGTGALLATFFTDGSEVQSASFSPDGKRIVTASFDGIARIWNVEAGGTSAAQSQR